MISDSISIRKQMMNFSVFRACGFTAHQRDGWRIIFRPQSAHIERAARLYRWNERNRNGSDFTPHFLRCFTKGLILLALQNKEVRMRFSSLGCFWSYPRNPEINTSPRVTKWLKRTNMEKRSQISRYSNGHGFLLQQTVRVNVRGI